MSKIQTTWEKRNEFIKEIWRIRKIIHTTYNCKQKGDVRTLHIIYLTSSLLIFRSVMLPANNKISRHKFTYD